MYIDKIVILWYNIRRIKGVVPLFISELVRHIDYKIIIIIRTSIMNETYALIMYKSLVFLLYIKGGL